jgi:N-acetylneuraminic acid mutarotase
VLALEPGDPLQGSRQWDPGTLEEQLPGQERPVQLTRGKDALRHERRVYRQIEEYPGGVRAPPLAVFVMLLAACGGQRGASPPAAPTVEGVEWRQFPPAPTPRTEVTAAIADGRIHVSGGFAPTGETVATVEVFDTRRGSWSPGPDLPVPVNHAASAGVDGAIYVLGGYLGPSLSNPTDRGFVLRAGNWEELPRMPEVRAAAGAAALDGRIYLAGGVGPEGLARNMVVFDPEAGRWQTAPGPPTPREHLGVAAADGRLFVVGGRTGGIGTNLGAAEAFDPDLRKWVRLPDMPTPRGGIAAAATANGYVVAPGGEAETTFAEAEALDVRNGRWVTLPPLPTARHGIGVASVADTVYVIAGGPQPGFAFSDANEAIDLSSLR